MISYGRQFIDKQDIKEVVKTLKSDYLTQGPAVNRFEKNISAKLLPDKFYLSIDLLSHLQK